MEAAAALAASKVEPEEVAPIMGRKRKQQKEKHIHSAAGGSTPAASRPPSPGPGNESIPEETSQKNMPLEPEVEVSRPTPKSKGKGKHRSQAAPPPPPVPSVEAVIELEEEPETMATESKKPQASPTPATILQFLLQSGDIPDVQNLALLKNLASNTKVATNIEMGQQAGVQKLTITPEDRATLLAGQPVRKNQGTPHPTMLTPNGDYVKYLTPVEEHRYLELQERLAKGAGPAAFVSNKHHASNGFTLIGGRAVPNGPPSFFPQPKGSGSTLDPVSKIQRDEALSYINQYVLPSLSTNSQLEKALNANALDAEMLRSSDPLSYPSWGNDPAGPRASSSHGDGGSQEGILATGLEGMTARFAVGRDGDSGRPLGNVSLLSLAEAETAMQAARKDVESIEKKFQALMKKNRRLLIGTGH